MDSPACGSCKIIFIGSDSVFASICGHLFHETCLGNIRDAKCCPECNVPCLASQSLRVFLPHPQETSTKKSLVTKLKMMKYEMKEVQKDFMLAEAVQSHAVNLIEKVNMVNTQKNQKMSELKILAKEKENMQTKIKNLEKMWAVQKSLVGTSNDVDKILKEKQPADTLATMAVSLKRETKLVKAEKNEKRLEIREHRKENSVLAATYRNHCEKFDILVARSINKGSKN